MAKNTNTKKGRKKTEDGGQVALAYFRPTLLQKVQILNRLRLWNGFLWGKFVSEVEWVEREQRWQQTLEYVQSLGIPNCPDSPGQLQKVWRHWKSDYKKKENKEKATGSAPVVWNEAEQIIREILAGNRAHQSYVKVR